MEEMLDARDSYRYALTPGVAAGTSRFKVNLLAWSDALAALEAPNGETALTARFLSQAGFKPPDQWLVARYATYDAEGRDELLVFYMEPLDRARLDLGMVGPSDLPEFESAFERVRTSSYSVVGLRGCARPGKRD